jgi:hypothetical protein
MNMSTLLVYLDAALLMFVLAGLAWALRWRREPNRGGRIGVFVARRYFPSVCQLRPSPVWLGLLLSNHGSVKNIKLGNG